VNDAQLLDALEKPTSATGLLAIVGDAISGLRGFGKSARLEPLTEQIIKRLNATMDRFSRDPARQAAAVVDLAVEFLDEGLLGAELGSALGTITELATVSRAGAMAVLRAQLGPLWGFCTLLLEGIRALPVTGEAIVSRCAAMSLAEAEALQRSEGRIVVSKTFAWFEATAADRWERGKGEISMRFQLTSTGRRRIGRRLVLPPLSCFRIGRPCVWHERELLGVELFDVEPVVKMEYVVSGDAEVKTRLVPSAASVGRVITLLSRDRHGAVASLALGDQTLGVAEPIAKYATGRVLKANLSPSAVPRPQARLESGVPGYNDGVKARAEAGDASAQWEYGTICEQQKKDDVQAAQWYKRAADQGHGEARLALAECLRNGRGVRRDEAAAVRLTKLAADEGCGLAQLVYSMFLDRGRGVKVDLAAAARYAKMAADQGLAHAQNAYACALYQGRGVPTDARAAAHYFALSAGQGDAYGQVRYARCLLEGIGVTKDAVQAARYFKLAADRAR
jgi:hypothetical protein